jgi:hypothetical protein
VGAAVDLVPDIIRAVDLSASAIGWPRYFPGGQWQFRY